MREAFVLPDRDCVRATKREMNILQLMTALTSETAYGLDELKDRMALIPDGEQRYKDTFDELFSILRDIYGTLDTRQANQIMNVTKDLKVRLVPRIMPDPTMAQISKDEFKELITCAKEKCKFFTEDGESCKNCRLYGVLIARVPLEEYADGVTCPYAYAKWKDDEDEQDTV